MLIPNLISARNRANDSATQAYIRNIVTGVEILRNGVTGALPLTLPACKVVAGKGIDPAAVKANSCIVILGISNKDAYIVNVTSVSGNAYTYNGEQIKTGTSTAP